MHERPLQKSLQKFAEENFSNKYYACLHGQTKKINLLALAIRRHRWPLTRPFAKSELIILDGLEKYMETKEAEKFRETLKNLMTSEEMAMQAKKLPLGASSGEYGVDVSGLMEVTVKLHQELGDIRLGRLRQHYITDPDLRGLLAETALENSKMEPYEEEELLLIISVINSDKLEVTGERINETEVTGTAGPKSAKFLFPSVGAIPQASALYNKKTTPPGVAARNVQGPVLFKCCKVTYNKKSQRLEIPKGEYIGKTVIKRRLRDGTEPPPKEDDGGYDDTLVILGEPDETDSSVYTAEDLKRLDTIERELLIPEKDREQRKARISKYRTWFEKSLSTDQDKLTVEEPLTSQDCRFLRQTFLSCDEDANMLDFRSLSKDDIQAYGIILKGLDDLPDGKWSELEEELYGPE